MERAAGGPITSEGPTTRAEGDHLSRLVDGVDAGGPTSEHSERSAMKAIVCEQYGLENMRLREIDKPAVDADRVLVRVRASSVNPADLHGINGGMLLRVMSRAVRRPRTPIPGSDVAGTVEAVGENVTELQVGDEVFGTSPKSWAESTVGKNLVPKPGNVTFEQAGSVGIAGITALQGLRDKGQMREGETVLINGAAGGVGTFAVQIAKAFGGKVTGVCSGANVELVRSLGADHVTDYTREDFAKAGQAYDLVFDLVGNRSLSDLRRVLKPEGVLVLAGGGHYKGHGARIGRSLLLIGRAVVLNRFVSQRLVTFIAQINKPDLLVLKDLMESGKVKPVIDRSYPLAEAARAVEYLQGGHARGKVVISV